MTEQDTKPNDLQTEPAVLVATIQIKRAATGKVEEFTLIGTPIKEEKKD